MDDCFSKKRKDEPDKLLDRLNINYHPNINFPVEENPDHFLDTAFTYGNDGFDCKVYKKPGKLPTHWTSEVPMKWKRNCITGALHRAKNISTNLDRDIKEIKTTFLNAGYPKKFVSYTIDNFASSKSSEDEPLIPDFLFEERKKICIKLPYCKKNEITSKKFISKLNSFTNFKYIFIILWQTRQIKSLFSLKDKNLHKSHVIYEGECSYGEDYVGETMRNLEVRITEHSNICHTSDSSLPRLPERRTSRCFDVM